MRKSLTKGQIEHISKLLELKDVEYYDVNMELTDHIASEVEELLSKERITYMSAVKKVFLRYERLHFTSIQDEKKKKLRKQATFAFFKGLLKFFTIPKIILTVAIFLLVKMLLDNINSELFIAGIQLVPIVFVILFFIVKRKLFGEKNYLQLNISKFFLKILWIPAYTLFYFKGLLTYLSELENFFGAAILTFSIIISLAAMELIKNQVISLRKQYA